MKLLMSLLRLTIRYESTWLS
ncbi:hypothetical protein Godav_023472, partial [Gossypium davidsonii]|nr:hypothetical protein [Gossypium davidsonii]